MHRTWTSKDKFTYIKAIHKNNYSQAKSLRMQSGAFTPCPIKPTQNAIPKDLNLQSIFTNMLQSAQTLNKSYPIPHMTHIYQNTNLSSNRNSNKNNISRKSLLKSIYDFFTFFHIDHKIFFKTILLYDMISIENERKKLLSSIEEIALGAMIISIKFNYIENKMFSMKKFLQFYGEQVYSLSEIIDIERKALQTINYYLNFTTPMCFLEFFLINGIIYNTDGLNKDNYAKIYIETENILKNIMEESNNYLKFNFFYLACAIVAYCREIFNLEKWPKTLEKVFSVNYYYFQKEYSYFFGKIINASIGRIYDIKTFNSNGNEDIIIGNNNILLLDIDNIENNNSINSLNSINSITSINNYNNYFGKYNHLYSQKTNNYKTIDYYNNIINININNVSFNNIYNNGIKNNFTKEENVNNNPLSNRSSYKRHFTSIYYNNIKKYNNRYNISLQNVKNSESEEKDKDKEKKEIAEYSNKNLSKKLPEIKEVKEVKDNSEINVYKSPPKRKRKHYFIFNKEENKYVRNNNNTIETEEKEEKNENEDKKETKENNNKINTIEDKIKIENNENVQDKENISRGKERTEKRYKRNHYIYYSNNSNIRQKDSKVMTNSIKGFDFDENSKKELNIINNISSNNSKEKNGTIEINSIRINRNNFKDNEIKIENNRYNRKRTSNNIYSKLNSEKENKMEIESNKNSLQTSCNNITEKIGNLNNNSEIKNILVGKKTYNSLVSKYLKFKHHNTEKKELIDKENKNNKYNMSNIKPEKVGEKSQNKKSDNLSNNKYDISRIRQSYKRYKNYKLLNNINSINNIDIKNDNNDNESININDKGCYEIKIREKKNSKNKKKHKGENKLKYNNLIKQKLFKCESINKRKSIWKNDQDK